MKYINKNLYFGLCVSVSTIFVLSSCTRYYCPPAQNIPLLSENHEVQLNAGLSTIGLYASGAVSPLPHVGIITNAMTSWSQKNKLTYTELAGGYYTGFQQQLNLEIYGGYGHGNSGMNDTVYPFLGHKKYYHGNGKYDLLFAQANAGINLDSMVFIAAGLRYIFMFNYRSVYMQVNNDIYHNLDLFGKGLEFTYQMKFGYKSIYAVGGGTLSLLNIDNSDRNYIFRTSPLIFYGGIVLRLKYR